mgnify:FL=1
MTKKIFITGCAKSGTTLLLRMCYAFEDVDILYRRGFDGHELPFDEFVKYTSDKKFIIGKRHPPALLSNVLTKTLDDQYDVVKRNNIAIINVVRDGRDVVLSDGNYVKPQRWIESIKQRDFYKDVIKMEVRYEDLIRNPEKVQKQMEDIFGMQSSHQFADYPDYVEDWVFEWNVSILGRQGKSNETNYGKRELSDKSVGKDLEAYKDLCSDIERPEIDSCLQELEYM